MAKNGATLGFEQTLWLRDESLEDSANLPDPGILAAEIIEDLQAITDDLAETPGARHG